MSESDLPTYKELLWPTLEAVRELGGSASITEIDAEVQHQCGFTEEQRSVPHGNGPRSEIEYRTAWARSYLKGMGLLANSSRGSWSLTPEGKSADEADIEPLHKTYTSRRPRHSRTSEGQAALSGALSYGTPVDDGTEIDTSADADAAGDETLDPERLPLAMPPERDWQEILLDALMEMPTDAFERLAGRLLLRAGYDDVEVTGRTGDGGIDGFGTTWYKLTSFRVYVQCKRYTKPVGPELVRDFRGALDGRGERGLLITTSHFTPGAKNEAKRPGAKPIDLIDGRRLCELLREHELGVSTAIRQVEDISVDTGFFQDI
ncbi:restriction endonuclease [Sphaerisporangium sp. TRM90804]|uniref:restriction endonuclease n=1 Tax=Sphaerisporangium sp. TRM90804 TaxID=3031113 RepID=UPI00244CD782|nr:restriction endonuclease [Sphaerisporangium sp. TRM90804]MDH2429877.1 restriction endonuclease [Sphaerisporangium sp. TRM90804]